MTRLVWLLSGEVPAAEEKAKRLRVRYEVERVQTKLLAGIRLLENK